MKKKTDRREFLKKSSMLGLGIASTCILSNAQIKAEKNSFEIKLALASYTTRSLTLDKTIEITKRLDLKHLALKDKFHLPLDAPSNELIKQSKMIRDHGIDFFGGGVHYMNSIEQIDKVFNYANVTGIKIIVGVVNPAHLEYANKKIIENDKIIAIHNHGPEDETYPSPESAYRLIENLDSRFGLCIDIGHTLRCGYDPAKDILRFSDRLYDIHLKDLESSSRDARVTEVGRGVIDIVAILKALKKINFKYTASFEHEKDGQEPTLGLAESVGYVRGVFDLI